ncbi:DUF885 domain-containing protein [Labedaea rhizosphaerae]|uniref:Uncharacterized protein (DUF885 family) n=1 Tax=Labedaea rhizosphaerae TaxID=598644 RepID=A0A4V3D046_LABRH|nr:DUF885 domain-containing protein [Labedaea rhizosphaerae]TDQ04315.1 uncharacterized protein (DUF885 family) [Labedaea rhizosphaerae]
MTDAPTAAALADDLLDAQAVEMPVVATLVGIPGHDRDLPDLTLPAQARLRERVTAILEQARTSSDDDRVTLGLVVHQAEAILARLDARMEEFVLADPMDAQGAKMLSFLPQLNINGEQAEQDFLARLAGLPAFYETLAQRHRDGIAGGRAPVDRMARKAVAFVDRFLEQDSPFPQRLCAEHAAERDRVYTEQVRPALRAYRDVLADEVVGKGRDDDHPGLCHLEGGQEVYAALARMHTTTALTPRELHDIGLDVIAKLDEEYREIGGREFGLHTAAEVQERLRTDPAMRWRDADELLTSARAAVVRATEAAKQWFKRVPKAECVVEPVPEADGPVASGAYYYPPALDGSKPGTFFANTYRAETRDKFIAESLAFHEAVPGHHFQIALAQEMTDVPMLRRLAEVTAHAEGWALYAERLADEMGLFSNDLMRLGMLAEDSMRAARLVVDTGIHALGWTRQQCVDYLRAHTVMNETEVQSETDRYIECPGQALAYMVGRLELQRMRRAAEAKLGEKFDVKDFHDVVLSTGPLPMSVLADVVAQWAEAQA